MTGSRGPPALMAERGREATSAAGAQSRGGGRGGLCKRQGLHWDSRAQTPPAGLYPRGRKERKRPEHAPQGRAAEASRRMGLEQHGGAAGQAASQPGPGSSTGTHLCEVRGVVEGHCGPGRALCGRVVAGSLRAQRAHLSKTTAHSALRSVCDTHTF